MRVLVVEDEPNIAKSIKRGLEQEGYATDMVADGETAENRINMYRDDYDAVLLDLMLPGQDGFAVLRHVRQGGVKTPVLVLTARDLIEDKVAALDEGADDYLVKPFSFKELSARLRALTRRPEQLLQNELSYRNIRLDPATQQVYLVGEDAEGTDQEDKQVEMLELTLKEFRLLEYLMRNQDRVLKREEIISHVWDFENDSFSNFLDVHMKNLRRKLGELGEYIETVRGIGYRLT